MSNLNLLRKTTHGPLDADRAVMRSAMLCRGVNSRMPVVFGGKKIATVGWDPISDSIWAAPFTGDDDLFAKTSLAIPKTFSTIFTKVAANSFTANQYYDLWPCSGDPNGGTYPGAAATAYVHSPSTDPGFPSLGPPLVSAETRHITGIGIWGKTSFNTPPSMFILYDRVLVYNACAVVNALTNMTNTVVATRYAGVGVQIMVTLQTVLGAGSTMTALSYNNQAGATKSMPGGSLALIGSGQQPAATIASTVLTPLASVPLWLPLVAGDYGVQRINSWTCNSAQTGAICFVLAKPLCTIDIPVLHQKTTYDYVRQQVNLSQLADDACLSLVGKLPGNDAFVVGVSVDTARG